MKRRMRYGEKYSGIPYPEEFKTRMLTLFPDDDKLKEALDGGWHSVGGWLDELCAAGPAIHARGVLYHLEQEAGVSKLKALCEAKIQRREELLELNDMWQRIVYLDDQDCTPWEDK